MVATPAILLVDDEVGDVHLAHRALTAVGCQAILYAVHSCELAAEFLEKHQAFAAMPTPDLVVLDMHLPGSSGLDLLARMKAHPAWKEIPVVVLTFSLDDETRRRCLGLGAAQFQVKPGDEPGYRRWARSVLRLLAGEALPNGESFD